MTRVLETAGFLGLAVMMAVGLYQTMLLEGGSGVPQWLVVGHAHLGVLSIIGIVVGFAVDAFGLAGRLRSAVTGLFLVGQWLLPFTIWIGLGFGMEFLMPTTMVWGVCLVVAMLVMTWQAARQPTVSSERPPSATPADD